MQWDDKKRAANIVKHSIDFLEAAYFDWETAVVIEDERYDYGEPRYQAFGRIHERLFCLVFTPRGDEEKIISLRKATKKEIHWYEQECKT
jgi:uncharacterized protein